MQNIFFDCFKGLNSFEPEYVYMLSERDIELIDLLTAMGLKKQEAKVIVGIYKGLKFSRDIERTFNLRQPEVSEILRNFIKRGWIKEEIYRNGRFKRGRPLKKYDLAVDFKEICRELIDRKKKELKQMQEKIERLERLVKKI